MICVVRLGHGKAELKTTTGVEFGKRGRLQQAFEDREALLASCTEPTLACVMNSVRLETARHFLLTTALEKAGEGGVIDGERVRHVTAAEALLPLEIFRCQTARAVCPDEHREGRRDDLILRLDAVHRGPEALRRADRR